MFFRREEKDTPVCSDERRKSPLLAEEDVTPVSSGEEEDTPGCSDEKRKSHLFV